MIVTDTIIGFPHSELLIKGAIDAALADIRSNPYLLDYVFMWYTNDTLTNNLYGEKARQAAKKWIMNTEIFVSMAYRVDLPKFPMISILPRSSTEDYSTLGDVNYDTIDNVSEPQDLQVNPNIVVGPFNSPGYNYIPSTGTVTLPTALSMANVMVNMLLVDVVNNIQYPILTIVSATQFTIAPNVNINLTNAYVTSAGGQTVTVESVLFRESYDIYCYVMGSADELYYLETLVQFILYRYKQVLLEGRGFDRTTVSLGPVTLEQRVGIQERIFFRVISLKGYIRKYWPKFFGTTLQGFNVVTQIQNTKATPPAFADQVSDSSWEMSQDSINGSRLIEDDIKNNT